MFFLSYCTFSVIRMKDCAYKLKQFFTIQFDLSCQTRGQFHHHFTPNFFAQKCFAQLFSTNIYLEKSCQKRLSYKKGVRKMLMKLTPGRYI